MKNSYYTQNLMRRIIVEFALIFLQSVFFDLIHSFELNTFILKHQTDASVIK